MKSKGKELVITKRIAKHGRQAVIVIPKIFENMLKPGTITKLTIEVVQEANSEGRK